MNCNFRILKILLLSAFASASYSEPALSMCKSSTYFEGVGELVEKNDNYLEFNVAMDQKLIKSCEKKDNTFCIKAKEGKSLVLINGVNHASDEFVKGHKAYLYVCGDSKDMPVINIDTNVKNNDWVYLWGEKGAQCITSDKQHQACKKGDRDCGQCVIF